jgi:DNA (cytosine-5)-methyltransferase 1
VRRTLLSHLAHCKAAICGNSTGWFLVESERYGVPQTRHRVILVGIRSEIPGTPRLLEQRPTVPIEAVIADLPRLRSALSQEPDSGVAWRAVLLAIAESNWLRSERTDDALRQKIRKLLREVDD